ncbi:EmrB/QacA subfamily drug resistance transporter [Bacillus pakistanensis]|uniref:EmrB/QacA subfamily drug resistance transporter n=1 Tax=Rossellomorea pakistanensis TaxID=992288 RepID=A0ABS2NHL8_9BACI|nr:MDR family MFS transporter [Bacillus pakistanensis]MBM7587337.1 EmrB/QacA subfamily drug resistance transporter [Bacillus pakistanensis]
MRQIKSGKNLVVTGLLLSILMASMDNTIVATAMGTIVGDLGGLDKFIWVTSAYMVAEMAGMPIFGKLSDMFGRKRFFMMGLIFFMFGSILCGTAQTIEQLSVYRAIQGIGGGALIPITFTIIIDLFPPGKRGKMSGLFGAVFGLSSIFGPLLGAYITDYISWHWIFYINLPIGVLSLTLIALFYKESLVRKKQKIDWIGSITLVGAIVCLLFALELGGNEYTWDSIVILSLLAGFAILFTIFFIAEKNAEDPIISFSMFKDRLFASSTIVGLFYGVSFIVGIVYIPIFIQGVTGGSATNSGLILLPMMLGVVVSSQIGATAAPKIGFRSVMLIFSIILLIGMYLLSTVSAETSRTIITLYMIIIGLGTGASFSVINMAAIHSFGPESRGSATSTVSFLRQLGMSLGITIYGIIQHAYFSDKIQEIFGGNNHMITGGVQNGPRSILSEQARERMPEPILNKISVALADSISYTFTWALIPSLLALFFVFFLSNDRISSIESQQES